MNSKILRYFLENFIGKSLSIVALVVMVPFLLDIHGEILVADLILIISIVAITSTFDFGVTKQIIVFFSSSKSSEERNIYFSQAFFFTTLTSIIISVLVVFVISYYVNFSINFNLFEKLALIGTIYLNLLQGVFRGILESQQMFVLTNVLKVFVNVSIVIFPVIFDINNIFFFICILKIIELSALCLACSSIVKITKKNDFQFYFDLKSYGLIVMAVSFCGPILSNFDKFFVNSKQLLGYSFIIIALEIISRTQILSGALTTATFGLLAKDKSKNLFSNIFRFSFMMFLGILIIIITVASFFQNTSLVKYDEIISWLIILSPLIMINALASVIYTQLLAKKITKKIGILYAIELPTYILVMTTYGTSLDLIAMILLARCFLDFILLSVFDSSCYETISLFFIKNIAFIVIFVICLFLIISDTFKTYSILVFILSYLLFLAKERKCFL